MEEFINNHPIITFLCFILLCGTIKVVVRGWRPESKDND